MLSTTDDVSGNKELSVDGWSPLIQRFSSSHKLSSNEINALNILHEQVEIIDANATILHEGQHHNKCMIIINGWACRFTILKDGGRQVINYYLPGDIISPFASVQPLVNYSVSSLTELNVFTFNPDCLLLMFSAEPRLGLLYGHMLGREDSMSAEQITRLGRRSAYQRTAHLLLELFHRLKFAGRTGEEGTYLLPLSQELLADTLGMTFVHMNRTLSRLRSNNLIHFELHKMTLLNINELIAIAEYKNTYIC
jgi:CRP-like cAMP-binding protein